MTEEEYYYSAQCIDIAKKGQHIVINKRPCKIVEVSIYKTGKHGSCKAHMTGIDIFNGKKYEMIESTSHNVNVPYIDRTRYTLVNIDDDNYLSLLDDNGNTRNDIKIVDNNMIESIKKSSENDTVLIDVLKSFGEEHVVSFSHQNN